MTEDRDGRGSGLVQPIAVVPGTHEDTVRAVALASALALGAGISAQDETVRAPWSAWLSERFTKSVRRMRRPAEIRRVDELRAELDHETVVIGSAAATAFTPMAYADFPPALSKLQVSGLDQERTGDGDDPGPSVPRVVLTDAVSMSTGKSAAQAAHALGLWVLTGDPTSVGAWVQAPRLHLAHGLTEIAPHTTTAILIPPGVTA